MWSCRNIFLVCFHLGKPSLSPQRAGPLLSPQPANTVSVVRRYVVLAHSIIAVNTFHVSTSLRPRICNRTVSPQPTTPCRSCIDMFSSHSSSFLAPQRTDLNHYFYRGQYLACFHESQAKNLYQDCVSTANNPVSVVRPHVSIIAHGSSVSTALRL